MELSVIIPAFNEIESLPALLDEIAGVCSGASIEYEAIVIDDGSSDGTFDMLRQRAAKDPVLKAVKLRHNSGKAAALSIGFKEARGDFIITMDADLQDNPEEIPGIIQMLKAGADVVSGWKKKRHDPFHKTFPSKVWNFMVRLFSGVKIHDFNCGLKGYRKEVVKSVRVYGELHRYIPVIAHWQSFKVEEKVVMHRPRKFGRSKYGVARFANGFFDLMTLLFLHRYNNRPLHLFGFIGLCFTLAGFGILTFFTLDWAITGAMHMRPLLLGGFVSILLGFQIVSLGLLAELITSRSESDPPVGEIISNGQGE